MGKIPQKKHVRSSIQGPRALEHRRLAIQSGSCPIYLLNERRKLYSHVS